MIAIPSTLDPLLCELLTNSLQFSQNHHSYPIPMDKLRKLLGNTLQIVITQPNLRILEAPFTNTLIVGDLHGDLSSLGRIIHTFLYGVSNEPNPPQSLIFLGDYIDRGSDPLLTFLTILILLQTWPDRICILCGNHENDEVHHPTGRTLSHFEKKIRKRYFNIKDCLYIRNQCHMIMANLPWAAITPEKSLCIHGGIPEGLENISVLANLPKNTRSWRSLSDAEFPSVMQMEQLLWNDPDEALEEDFGPSDRGSNVRTFGAEALHHFLEKNGALRLIRSHESIRGGFQTLFHGQLLHIFSNEPYGGTIPTAYILWEKTANPTRILTLDGVIDRNL